MKVSENFFLEEFIPNDIYLDNKDNCLRLIDSRIITIAQYLRDKFGSLTINDWNIGGHYSESGFRRFDTNTGAQFSQHKYGRAIDCKFKDKTPKEVSEYILNNQSEFLDIGLTVLENVNKTTTWLHCDCRTTGLNKIIVVNP